MTDRPVAFITGITGQDGSYLTEFLLAKGYVVHGLIGSGSSSFVESEGGRIHPGAPLLDGVHLHFGDLSEDTSLIALLRSIRPTEVYHLAGQSDVRLSFEVPQLTAEVNLLGTMRLLEAIRACRREVGHDIRFVQATSSEMYGRNRSGPQNEQTPFTPCTPYACTRVHAFWQAVNYREAYGMFLCNGILFNHESPRRGEMFVTRKITRAAARIKLGLQQELNLGNLDARRDWGFAGDYVRGLWLMLQQPTPDDYVLATGVQHSLKEWLEIVFHHLGLDWRDYVKINRWLLRPQEVGELFGDFRKARERMKWVPSVTFEELAKIMVDSDLELARQETIRAKHATIA